MDRLSAFLPGAVDPARLRHLGDLGLVEVTERRLRVTRAGRSLLNAILRDLLA
jgi:coproporphyrinogen III oxidase-like Fe-S oxidoreductase